jgi:hypothetical protein
MANQPDSPKLFNPFALWADLGMRATDAAVSSTQNMTEGTDRVTRAGAWDLMTENWVRWMSTVGNLMSASAGVSLARAAETTAAAAEHALASDEPKPRRKAAAKPKRVPKRSR